MEPGLAIRAEGVGKKYRLGEFHGNPWAYGTLTDAIGQRVRNLVRREPRAATSAMWALRDVDFEVKQGETFGIIGHNGAGKSTLLKIISRVTQPSAGDIHVRGRAGTLLEVGTGFHYELTGRENIFLNGAILGMKKVEIERKFDEIVSFAEVERFIDTPVKRYSTGMYLRLGFAVAAHLEPEVLIIDEVLSVGDLAFQRKCLGRMETVAGEGRTVLFVSHNLAAVKSLCQRCMLLSRGEKVTEGPPHEVIDRYVGSISSGASSVGLADRLDRQGTGRLRFQEVMLASDGEEIDSPATGDSFDFILRYETLDRKPLRNVSFTVRVTTPMGQPLLDLDTDTAGVTLGQLPGEGEVRCTVPRCPLPAGEYTVTLSASLGGEHLDWIERAFHLSVREGDFFGSARTRVLGGDQQTVFVPHNWSVSPAHEMTGRISPTKVPTRLFPG